MPKRLAAAASLIVFAACLVIGGFQADNPFTTTVSRALVAMFGTLVIGLILGAMGQRMLDEHLATEKEKLEQSSQSAKDSPAADR